LTRKEDQSVFRNLDIDYCKSGGIVNWAIWEDAGRANYPRHAQESIVQFKEPQPLTEMQNKNKESLTKTLANMVSNWEYDL
jgi:hypothetical protein